MKINKRTLRYYLFWTPICITIAIPIILLLSWLIKCHVYIWNLPKDRLSAGMRDGGEKVFVTLVTTVLAGLLSILGISAWIESNVNNIKNWYNKYISK